MFAIGACFGSFLCCQARRLHLKEQGTAKSAKPTKSTQTSSQSTKHHATKPSMLGNRSVCLHCGHQLKWYDNLPILSWFALRGRCRKCHHKIGLAEILSELGTALAFLALGATVDIGTVSVPSWAAFVVMLMLTIVLIFLAIYDGLYGELPTIFLIMAIVLAFVVIIFKIATVLVLEPFNPSLIFAPLLSTAILGGLYLVLYLISKGKWVGDGDWLLATAIGLALGNPWLAFITLFFANLLACIIMAPFAFRRKKHQIYFGPFLVIAFVITLALAPLFQSLIKF